MPLNQNDGNDKNNHDTSATKDLPVSSHSPANRPENLAELNRSDWQSVTVKQELARNFIRQLRQAEDIADLYPGVIGYENTVIPEINIALLAGHDLLFLGEKGQGKSRLMRLLSRFLNEYIPYIDFASLGQNCPVHEDPRKPITQMGKDLVASRDPKDIPIAWWHRDERYAERLAPGTKFADIIGEIDPAKLLGGESMSSESALHFGMIPRMHRGMFAMNELPELDELVQVGLFNILEERDVQIRGFPISFDIDTFIMFSANPSTYNRSGKVIPQLKDRIGSVIHTHYPTERDLGISIMEQEVLQSESNPDGITLDGEFPVAIPYFMKEVVEQITVCARRSKYIDHQSGVSARFSIANYSTMIASARHRAAILDESPAVPRISDLSHIYSSSLGKLELDMMGASQLSERQVLENVMAQAIAEVFEEYVTEFGLAEISEIFGRGVRVEVSDMMPSSDYEKMLQRVPPAWEKAFEVNTSSDAAIRASCVEFVLAGLYATDRVSRTQDHGYMTYEFGSD